MDVRMARDFMEKTMKNISINKETGCKLLQIAQRILDQNHKGCSFVVKDEMLSKARSG
jgi:hypothetical protein